MITRLRIENFRSIKETTVDLHNFNCLVGRNNSGKSNILDSLRFVGDVASRGFQNAFGARSPNGLVFYGAGEDDFATISVDMVPSPHPAYYSATYKVGFKRDPNRGFIEELHFRQDDSDATDSVVLSSANGAWKLTQKSPKSTGTTSGGGHRLASILSRDEPLVRPVRSWLSGIRMYRFTPENLKEHGVAEETAVLEFNGSNFASRLHTIQSRHRRFFNAIEDQLKKSFPEVDELQSPLVGQQTAAGIKERWYEESATGRQLSDGLVGFLAHLVVLYGPDQPTLVSFEEPENYINPRLMERLVAMLKEASTSSQVLITTHSTSLLNRLDLDDLVVVEKEDKGTTTTRVSADIELREHLAGWALGDAYVSGVLGGVP